MKQITDKTYPTHLALNVSDKSMFIKIKFDLIIPHLNQQKPLGRLILMDIDYIDSGYTKDDPREEVLKLFAQGIIPTLKYIRATKYYKNRRKKNALLLTLWRIIMNYKLYLSMSKRGFQTDINDVNSFPWILCAGGANPINFRLDGHHRASMARFLGYTEIPVLLITPNDLLKLENLPNELVQFLESLQEPDIENLKPFDGEVSAG